MNNTNNQPVNIENLNQVLNVIEFLTPTQESDKSIYNFLSGATDWNPTILISIIRKLLEEKNAAKNALQSE
jgi:hypothetical protein